MKNLQFLPNSDETWGKELPHEVSIFPKFHEAWAKIVDFLLGHSDFKIPFLIKLRLNLRSGYFIVHNDTLLVLA